MFLKILSHTNEEFPVLDKTDSSRDNNSLVCQELDSLFVYGASPGRGEFETCVWIFLKQELLLPDRGQTFYK